MGSEVKPQYPLENLNYLNKLDEAFGFMCIHISRELLFCFEGRKNTKELWEKLKSLFWNEDELRGHILENDPIALHPSKLKNIQQIFSKFKILSMQFKQCGIDKNDEQFVLSIMRKLAQNYQRLYPLFTLGDSQLLIGKGYPLIPSQNILFGNKKSWYRWDLSNPPRISLS